MNIITMNKSLLTNLIAFLLFLLGYFLAIPWLLSIGLFAFSGGITNWLAVHMLFEKIPGVYGSGVIPARFEEFKSAIKEMMMTEFFSDENIDKFIQNTPSSTSLNLTPIIQKIDFSPAFERLLKVIMESSFGGMLNMFGGKEALIPLKEPFIDNMKSAVVEMTEQEEFARLLKKEMEQSETVNDIKKNISIVIDNRLNELTPALVKSIIQNMIQTHLGWLVVWGGLFGGLIGLISSFLI